jgi:hypothetical protein
VHLHGADPSRPLLEASETPVDSVPSRLVLPDA